MVYNTYIKKDKELVFMKLVVLEKNKPVTTSLIIAEGVKTEHHSVITLIRRHLKSLKEFGTLEFQVRKSGGRPLEFAILNEEQTTFLITCMRNTDTVIEFKIKLVKEFYKMKNVISKISERQTDEEWKLNRNIGKIARKEETDIIKEFVEYAKLQGSTKAEMYYSNISKMENKGLFLIQEKFKNIREVLTGQQLQVLCSADQIVKNAIKEGMLKNMNYKDIYLLAKERIEIFSTIIPKSIVPMLNTMEVTNEKL
jgi:phage regulator Rha-like protein